MIRVVCGACGARFKAKEEYAGRRGQCPRCQAPVRVPAVEDGGADAPAPPTEDAGEAEHGNVAGRDAGTPAPSAASDGPGSAAAAPAARRPRPAARARPAPRSRAPTAAPTAAGKDAGSGEDPPAPRRGAGARPAPATRAAAAPRRRPKTVAGSSSLDAAARLAGVRRRRRSGPLAVLAVLVVAALASWAIWISLQSMRSPGHFRAGMDHFNAGEFAQAREAFARVAQDDPNWAAAQEKQAEVARLEQADEEVARGRKEARQHANLVTIHDKHLGAYDPRTAEYAAYARYLLVRAGEFLQEFPGSEHAAEVTEMVDRLSGVASPDEPPSELDARVEVDLRVFGRQYGKAWEMIEAFDRAHPGEGKVLIELKTRVHEGALGFWEDLRGDIEKELLQPGRENWPSVLSRTQGFLDLVAGVPGVGREAQMLHDKARQMVGG